MMIKPSIVLLLLVSLISHLEAVASDTLTIVKVEDVYWTPLNPARGKNSPQAAQLWGNRTQNNLSGFLVKFKDGFASQPHIHNVGYRGVVISGAIHNDDPNAAHLWMSKGSFWTQPAGELHITSARGDTNMAYIEIDKGPYLVWPAIKAFDDGKRPVNIEARNIVWQSAQQIEGMFINNGSDTLSIPAVSFVWGKPGNGSNYGMLLKLPLLDDMGSIEIDSQFSAIVISDSLEIKRDTKTILRPGSYIGSPAKERVVTLAAKANTVIYIKTDGILQVSSYMTK